MLAVLLLKKTCGDTGGLAQPSACGPSGLSTCVHASGAEAAAACVHLDRALTRDSRNLLSILLHCIPVAAFVGPARRSRKLD